MSDMLPSATRILVVDDDRDLLLLLTKMLARTGASTQTAETGSSALSMLDAEPFDLLILDLMLPDMDGYDILRRVREDVRFNQMPVLILSAKTTPEAIKRGLELGADGYLTKPVSRADLQQALQAGGQPIKPYLPNTVTSRVRALLAQGRRVEP